MLVLGASRPLAGAHAMPPDDMLLGAACQQHQRHGDSREHGGDPLCSRGVPYSTRFARANPRGITAKGTPTRVADIGHAVTGSTR